MKTNTHRNIGAAVLLLGGLAGATSANAAICKQVTVKGSICWRRGARTQDTKEGTMRNPTSNKETTRWDARVGAMVIVTAALVAVQLAMAPPASAVTGLHRATGSSQINSGSPKGAIAFCDPGERVVGGGGWVQAPGAGSFNLKLTQLQPGDFGARDGYAVAGAETGPGGTTASWYVRAYALCAPAASLSGYRIVTSPPTNPSLNPVQATAAVCPAGQRVLGTGGTTNNPDGQVALQVSRASGTGDIARVQAHEDAAPTTPAPWSVVSHAICVNPPLGYEVVYGKSPKSASEPEKGAVAECPAGKRVHGAGAAVTNTAPGNVALVVVSPLDDLDGVRALAQENTPTSQNWDFIVAQAICAF